MPPLDGGFGPATGFYAVLTAAINAIMDTGYISPEQISAWVEQLRRAAKRSLVPEARLQDALNATMKAIYTKYVDRGELLKFHPGIAKFTLERVAPRLRAELDRRIMASANLIKLNREQAMETTLRRFQGWATSIPVGGTEVGMRRKVKEEVRKPLASLPFVERRVAVDQGHKLIGNLNNILATDAGALALIWHSHWRQRNYNYREDHKERDEQVYMIRGNWAQEKGLMKVGPAGYYDQITAVGEEVFCRCYAQYIYNLASLPSAMLTVKGREALTATKMAA